MQGLGYFPNVLCYVMLICVMFHPPEQSPMSYIPVYVLLYHFEYIGPIRCFILNSMLVWGGARERESGHPEEKGVRESLLVFGHQTDCIDWVCFSALFLFSSVRHKCKNEKLKG